MRASRVNESSERCSASRLHRRPVARAALQGISTARASAPLRGSAVALMMLDRPGIAERAQRRPLHRQVRGRSGLSRKVRRGAPADAHRGGVGRQRRVIFRAPTVPERGRRDGRLLRALSGGRELVHAPLRDVSSSDGVGCRLVPIPSSKSVFRGMILAIGLAESAESDGLGVELYEPDCISAKTLRVKRIALELDARSDAVCRGDEAAAGEWRTPGEGSLSIR